jgi:uncharacterized protein YmfQ (DUF2313 family)
MSAPILQTVNPAIANPGFRVVLAGHRLAGASFILALDGAVPVAIVPSVLTATAAELVIPLSTAPASGEIVAVNIDGFSSVPFRVVSDPALGVQLCQGDRSAEEYRGALVKLQPEGRVWTRVPASNLGKVYGASSEELARVRAESCRLSVELFPARTLELLDVWERELALPESCNLIRPLTIEERIAEVVRKVAAMGGNTIEYFRSLAALLGFNVEISEETNGTPFLVGFGRMGDRLYGANWLFTWYITIPAGYELNYFRMGDTMGTALRWWGASALECFFQKIKPAHTLLVVRFEDAPVGRWGFGFFPFGISPHGL